MRAPLVCGVAGGVGTTTIALALEARDLGVYPGGLVDIVVCRTTSASVAAAHRVINTVPGKPVLVVVADGPLRTPAAVKARLRMVQPHVRAVVAMPYVEHWREMDNVPDQAAAVLGLPDRVPKWLQPWAAALREVMDAVLPLVTDSPEAPTTASDRAEQRGTSRSPSASPEARAGVRRDGPSLVVVQGYGPIPPRAAGNSH